MRRRYVIGAITIVVMLLFGIIFFQDMDKDRDIPDGVCPYALQVDGQIYYCFLEELDDKTIADYEIFGTIKTFVSVAEMPHQDDEANFLPAKSDGYAYAIYEGQLAILIDDVWYRCQYVRNADT